MSRRIVIQPVTRIEGHAKISIQLDDSGQVEAAKFHVTEFRGFEKLCVGRPFQEMPGLMSRVCGICPVRHVLASSKAGDMLLGVICCSAWTRPRLSETSSDSWKNMPISCGKEFDCVSSGST